MSEDEGFDAKLLMILKSVVDIQGIVKSLAEQFLKQEERRAVVEKALDLIAADLIAAAPMGKNEVRKDFDVVAQKREREMSNKSQVWLPVVPEHVRVSGGVSPQEFRANREPRMINKSLNEEYDDFLRDIANGKIKGTEASRFLFDKYVKKRGD